MIRKIVPLVLILIGLAAGFGAGLMLRPDPPEDAEAAQEAEPTPDPALQPDYVKLNNQFVVPIVERGSVVSLVVLSLSLEVAQGSSEQVYAREPKVRDAFLQVLFDHANSGGFQGNFTDSANMVILRTALREVAIEVLGDLVTDVLIADYTRQDA
jgi:flagellar basal body-associated protein FliL